MSLLMANRALIKTVGGSPFPPVIEDGNSVGWYIGDDLSTITKDASDFMSEWRDYLGSGHNLLQALGSNQPKWFLNDGGLFDGIDNFMKAIFTSIPQPIFMYIVVNQKSWTNGDRFFDLGSSALMLRQFSSTPNLQAFGGKVSSLNSNLPIDTFGIIRLLFNGASGKFQINETTAITGDFGSNQSEGISLGTSWLASGSWSNIQVKEILLRSIADTAQDEQDIYDYLANKYSI